MDKEEKYVLKVRNDVEEKLYELLILHLRDIDTKIRIHGEDNEALRSEFVNMLDSAITDLCNAVTKYNKLAYYRYIILLSNTILRFDKGRQDLKDLKKELIEDYTHSERDEHGYIP